MAEKKLLRGIVMAAAALLAAALCLAFAACDDGGTSGGDNGGGGTSTLSGTYQGDHPPGSLDTTCVYKFIFSGNAFTTTKDGDSHYKGTYTISGSAITFKITEEYISGVWTAKSMNGEATLSSNGNSFTTSGTTYTKQP
jgi:hypothetical protein